MSFFRILSYLVLALALVAGGVAPGLAQEAQPQVQSQVQPPCHGMDGELVSAMPDAGAQGECCEGPDCRCDCLQHSPASAVVLRHLPPVVPARLLAQAVTASHAPARTLPATRPPIA